MGSLTLPVSGAVYVDAQAVIYSVERHPVYAPLLRPLWTAASTSSTQVVASELLLLETLVAPYKNNDVALADDYERLFTMPGIRLVEISRDILRDAARLRSTTTSLRTPDAIHAATARHVGCTLFVTNDKGFRRVPALPVVILDDIVGP